MITLISCAVIVTLWVLLFFYYRWKYNNKIKTVKKKLDNVKTFDIDEIQNEVKTLESVKETVTLVVIFVPIIIAVIVAWININPKDSEGYYSDSKEYKEFIETTLHEYVLKEGKEVEPTNFSVTYVDGTFTDSKDRYYSVKMQFEEKINNNISRKVEKEQAHVTDKETYIKVYALEEGLEGLVDRGYIAIELYLNGGNIYH